MGQQSAKRVGVDGVAELCRRPLLLNRGQQPGNTQAMRDFAGARGLPIIFPVLDFEDRRSLSENIVWNLDEQAIAAASERYGADSILAGRLHFTASGELVGLWQFLFQEEAEVFDGFDTDLQSYLYDPLNRITTRLAGYFRDSSGIDCGRRPSGFG